MDVSYTTTEKSEIFMEKKDVFSSKSARASRTSHAELD